MSNELAHESFMILERDDALVIVSRDGLLELNPSLDETLYPETDGAGKNRKRCDGDLTTALSATPSVRPREESENTPGASGLVAEIKMVGGRIVEVHRPLYQAQPKSTGVEIEISLRVAGNSGYMMNSGRAKRHVAALERSSCNLEALRPELPLFGRLALFSAGLGGRELTTVTAFVLVGMGRNVLRVGLTRTRPGIAVTLSFGRGRQ